MLMDVCVSVTPDLADELLISRRQIVNGIHKVTAGRHSSRDSGDL